MFTYDPGAIVLTFGSQTIVAYADGSFCKVARNEDAFSASWGGDGRATRARNRNAGGRFTFILAAGSPSNDYLSQVAQEDELSGTGVKACMVKDLLGNSLHSAEKAWVVKQPDVDYNKDANRSVEWVIECEKLNHNVGSIQEQEAST